MAGREAIPAPPGSRRRSNERFFRKSCRLDTTECFKNCDVSSRLLSPAIAADIRAQRGSEQGFVYCFELLADIQPAQRPGRWRQAGRGVVKALKGCRGFGRRVDWTI